MRPHGNLGIIIVMLLVAYVKCWCLYKSFSRSADAVEVDYSSDGTKMILVENRGIRLYETVGYTFVASVNSFYTNTKDKIHTGKFSKNGIMIAYGGFIDGSSNAKIVIVSATNALPNVKDISTDLREIFELDFNYDNSLIIVCGKSNDRYQIYNVTTKARVRQGSYGDDALCCRFASNGQYAVGNKAQDLYTYYTTGTQRWVFATTVDIFRAQWSEDSNHVLSGDSGGIVRLFNISANTPLRTHTFTQDVKALDWSRDQSYIAAGNTDGVNSQLIFFNGSYSTNPLLQSLQIHNESQDDLLSLRFSYNSLYLAVTDKASWTYIYKRNCAGCPAEQYNNGTDCRFCALDNKGCRVCNSSTYCFNCTDGYYIDTSTNRCVTCASIVKECWACTSSSVCTLCSVNYYLNAANQCSSCSQAIKGCVSCLNSTKCQICNSNEYYLNAAGSCIACNTLSNCIYCNSSSTCTFCKPSYYLNGVNCERCSQNCSTCILSTSCQTCDLGYYLASPLCQPCPYQCITCTSSTSCTLCAVGYFNSFITCASCTSPCASCSTTSTYCLTCNVGWHLASAGSCSSCPSACTACSSSLICLSCRPGYYLNVNTCTLCTNLAPFCQECTKLVCISCSSGYLINSSNSCTSCNNLLTGCQICNSSSQCKICSTQYYLSGTSCLICQSPCLSCQNSTKCQSCIIGYYLDPVNYNCLRCSQSCAACSSATTCTSCPLGYFLNSSSSCSACQLNISNCMVCFNQTVCVDCKEEYFWSGSSCVLCSNGCSTCNNSTSCVNCLVGYYLTGNSCSICSYKCLACNNTSNACISCALGYYLSSTNCLKCSDRQNGCLSCNNSICYQCDYELGYYLNSVGTCIKCSSSIPNCYHCSVNNTCTNCQITYTKVSATSCVTCSSLISNCQICFNSTYCTHCFSGNYIFNNSCITCQNGCQMCSNNSFCTKCITGYILQSNNTCLRCGQYMVGCQLCSSTSICSNCLYGYYLNVNQCLLCSQSINGCKFCTNSTFCGQCNPGYYINSSNSCQSCPLDGCIICNNTLPSLCLSCKRGYYLSNNSCAVCNITNCDVCSDSNNCLTCDSGYFFNAGNCNQCISKFSGCLFCNYNNCYSCKSGFYLNLSTSACDQCLLEGCEVCNNTVKTQCVTCNNYYYLQSTNICKRCNMSAALANCQLCLSSSTCFKCFEGFYVNSGSSCSSCSLVSYGCLNCTATTCFKCMNGFLLNNTLCQFCGSLIQGCSYCLNTALCLQCKEGYYLNGSICSECSNQQGCILCKDILNCKKCEVGYYLDSNSLCVKCNTTLTGCALCESAGICLVCQGEYELSGFNCQVITVAPAVQIYNFYSELSYTTEFVSQSVLRHIISVKGSTFKPENLNFTQEIQISYFAKGQTQSLLVQSFSWSMDSYHLYLYTDNPYQYTNMTSYLSPMSLFNKRLLNSYSSLTFNTKFQIKVSSSAIAAILPNTMLNGGAYFEGDTNSPEFISSLYKIRSYKYYLFGLFVTGYLFFFYAIFMLFVNDKNKGSIISHILYCKMPALTTFPAYLQLINYCSGFMFADLPWLNSYFKQFIDQSQTMPHSYAVFFPSMNISGTYMLPIAILTSVAVLFLLSYICFDLHGSRLFRVIQFLYCVFISGVIVASTINLIGFYQNNTNQTTLNSLWYIFGILIFLIIICHAGYLSFKNVNDLWRLRIIIKGILLNIISVNSVYLFILVICIQACFIVLQYKKSDLIQSKNIRLLSNILVNIPLILLYLFSHSLISIYLSSLLIIITLLLESVLSFRQYKIIRDHVDVKIDQHALKKQKIISNQVIYLHNKIPENITLPQFSKTRPFDISIIHESDQIEDNDFFILEQTLYKSGSKKKQEQFGNTFILGNQ